MEWVIEKQKFEKVLLRAKECASIDSGATPPGLRKLIFDDAQLLTRVFLSMIQFLMEISAETEIYYCVIDPDPELYFYNHFKRYPTVAIRRDESADDFVSVMNEALGGNSAEAIGLNWATSIIAPITPMGPEFWFCHLLRSATDNGGHLWIRDEWAHHLLRSYSFLRD